jgi:hypothetical protein
MFPGTKNNPWSMSAEERAEEERIFLINLRTFLLREETQAEKCQRRFRTAALRRFCSRGK